MLGVKKNINLISSLFFILILFLFTSQSFNILAQCAVIPNAIPTVSLGFVQPGGTNASGVAFNPNFNVYYAGIAGNSGFPLETFDELGNPLFQTNTGFDIRGLWWNFNEDQLEANGYNAFGIWTFNLNVTGFALNTGANIFIGNNQPTVQSVGDYNCVDNEIWYYDAGSIQKRDRATNTLISTLPITGLPVAFGNLNNNSVFYTDCLGHEIGLVDYQLKRIYFVDKVTGVYAGMSQLPASTVVNNAFRASWANGMAFLYDVATRTWFGFDVLTGFNLACSVAPCIPPLLITDDLTNCAPNNVDLNNGINVSSGIGNAQFYSTLADANASINPISNLVSSPGTYYVGYEDTLDASCFSVDSILVTITTINVADSISVCENSTVVYPDGTSEVVIGNTSHTSNLLTTVGCDSIVVTNVTMQPLYNVTDSISTCESSTVTYPDGTNEVITGNTTHTSNLFSVNGCDSIIVTNVTMQPLYNVTDSIFACESSTVTYPDGTNEVITGNTTHTSNLFSVSGCDSIIVSHVTALFSSSANVIDTVCFGEQYTSPQGNLYGPGSFNEIFVSSNGCDSIVTYMITELPLITSSIDESVCSGEIYTSAIGNTYSPGSYSEIFTSLSGCDSIVNINVTEYLPVIASFFQNQTDFSSLNNVEVTFINTSEGADSYIWIFGDSGEFSFEDSPIYSFSSSDIIDDITLIAYNSFGCSDTLVQPIQIEEPLIYYIPNAFTPDGDPFNNTFHPVFSSGYDPFDYTLLIFNRWGQLIFESHDVNIGWDGTFNGSYVQDGVYSWKVEFKVTASDERKENFGSVLMFR